MQTDIPSAAAVRARLETMKRAQLLALARQTDVPFTTLWKIRSGETVDPRLETVRKVWPVIGVDVAAAT
jgi:hypothetical protein